MYFEYSQGNVLSLDPAVLQRSQAYESQTACFTRIRYELDTELVAAARQAIASHPNPAAARLCRVVQEDLHKADVSSATILAL